MDVTALRAWGMAVSGALIAMCLAFALSAPAPRAAASGAIEAPAPAPLALLVRFQGGGPIARAQALAARGGAREAQRAIEAQLLRQGDFAGLCFDRFTVGAMEVGLRTCAMVAAGEQGALEESWLARLRAMPAVAYAQAAH